MKINIGQYPVKRWYHRLLGLEPQRKEKIRIDSWDTYNVDTTLSLIITPLLKDYIKSHNGSPMVDDEDVPFVHRKIAAPALSEKDLESGSVDANYHKRWEWVLKEMLFAFESINRDWEEDFATGTIDLVLKKLPDSDHLYSDEGPNHTYIMDEEGRKACEKRIQNGFRLFGKYYNNLWS